MLAREISDLFDHMALKSGGGLMLNEYDKSLLLSEAQLDYVKQHLQTYSYGATIDHILSPLLVPKEISTFTIGDDTRLYSSANDSLSDDVLQIVYERTYDINNAYLLTIPLDYNDLDQVAKNPFRKPDNKIAYRLTSNGKFHIFSQASVASYKYTYCKVPYPIILEDFSTLGLKVRGYDLPVSDYNAANPSAVEPVLSDKCIIDIVRQAIDNAYRRIPKKAETKEEN